MADTTYIVLRSVRISDNQQAWEVVYTDGLDARDSNDAIRKVAGDDFGHMKDEPPVSYVAVPARSWKPVQVEAVQTTVLKLT